MGQCYGKTIPTPENDHPIIAAADPQPPATPSVKGTPARSTSPWLSPFPFGSAAATPAGVSPSPARSTTPGRFFKNPFPPPSPAKHIRASLRKLGQRKKKKSPVDQPIPEDTTTSEDTEQQHYLALDRNFGYNKNLVDKYELGKEVGRGHFGHTCFARGRKGDLKDMPLAVKIISKSKVW